MPHQVLDVFSHFGDIRRITGPRFQHKDGTVRGWAIVNFTQQQSACLASWTFQAGNAAVAAEMVRMWSLSLTFSMHACTECRLDKLMSSLDSAAIMVLVRRFMKLLEVDSQPKRDC